MGLNSCAVQLGSSSQPGTLDFSPTASDTSNTAERSGRCDVTMSIPVTSGTYSCSVTVNPGNTQTSCGSFTINPLAGLEQPSTVVCCPSVEGASAPCSPIPVVITAPPSPPTISCPSDVIAENMPLTCTCNANNIGQPGGRLRWYTGTGSDFSTEVVSVNYDVTILGMTWTVTRGDNGRKFRCVNNWMVKVNAASDYTASVAYPPPSAPQISGYINGHILYQGDNLTLTCAVTGGDPQVTSVTLTCLGSSKQKSTDGQSSSLEFSPLSSSDHNLTCVCSGQWAMQGYYTRTDSRNLTVYSPPSTLSITQTGGDSRPALEGDNVTLTCSLTSSGYPSAEVTLTSEAPDVSDSSLSLGKVSKTDDKRNITCQVSNTFTENRGPPWTSTYTLHVYLGPYITVQPTGDNLCVMTSDSTSCHVTEGQRVCLVCAVESNPAPETCTWRLLSGTGRDSLGNGSNLDFQSANRTDSGVYQVEGRTTNPANDGRLPRTAHSNLTVLVTLAPQWGTADSEVITQSSLCLAPQWGTADSDVITQSSLCLAQQWGTADTPQRPANRGPSGSSYEDVMTEPGRNPQIISGPQPGPSASGEDNVYSVVNKPKKTSSAPLPVAGDDANVYSVVDKAPALPPPPPEAGPSNAGKVKPAAKPKPEKKGKQAKGKDKGKKKEEAEYGNIASSRPRDEDETEGTVYENYGFQGEGNEAAAAAPAASGGEGSRIPNADGLLYSTVDFTKEQRQKQKDPDPLRDNTDYAGIDFVEMAKAARKMSKK
ncbi:hypothetical protein ACOMHN_034059 [Nucella lapillus]